MSASACSARSRPPGSGWAPRCEYLTGYVTAGISTIMLGCLASLMLTMAGAKRVDHAWSSCAAPPGTVRSAARWSRIFAASVGVALLIFGIWFFLIQGPAPEPRSRAVAVWTSSAITGSSTTSTNSS